MGKVQWNKVVKFIQKDWLKPWILNTELKQQAINDFEKDFFKLMKNAVFTNTTENIRKHRDTKLVATEKKRKKRNCLASEPNYHTTHFFTENLLAIEMKKLKY